MNYSQGTTWRASLLFAGLLFHVTLISALPPGSCLLIGPALEQEVGLFVIGLYSTCSLVAICLYGIGGRYSAAAWTVLATALPLAFYISTFAAAWPVSLTGIAFVLAQLQILHTSSANVTPQIHPPGQKQMDEEWVDVIILCSLASLATVLLLVGHHLVNSTTGIISGFALVLLTVGTSLLYEGEKYPLLRHRVPRVSQILLLVSVLALIIPATRYYVFPLLALRQLSVSLRLWVDRRGGNQLWRYLTRRPPVLLVGGFGLAIVIGTALLALPAADASGRGLTALDALFTATSATCVTGLIVVDTGSDLTLFGQWVVLGLIQAGGLGIMTVSTFAALLLGRNIGLRGESALKETVTESSSRGALRLVKFIVGSTFVIELLGTVWLVAWWLPEESWADRVYGAVFHSISAFCNAGFSLYPDSLMRFTHNPGVPLGVSVLIVIGGLGFSVLFAVHAFRQRKHPQAAHVNMVLWTSVILLVIGSVLFLLLERGQSVSGVAASDPSVLQAWFQSVTARTAGFNTVDIGELGRVTQILLMTLMFIGGAPGSTAGGIKVTTFAVLILLVFTVLRGRRNVIFGGRRIEISTVLNASALVVLSAFAVLVSAILIMLTHPQMAGLDVAFETVSAFGTVGLSTGITGLLNPFGKLMIIVLMFLGRLGPLTVLLLMRPLRPPKFEYPAANVMIG
ncbi:MAG: TrkH family potassium uptake protein [Lentisphaeria bacterium]